jgi:hypothetical protein
MLNTDGLSNKPKKQCGTFDQLADFVKTLDGHLPFNRTGSCTQKIHFLIARFLTRRACHTQIYRKPTMLVGRHIVGVTTLMQDPVYDDAQVLTAQISLCMGNSGLVNSGVRLDEHVA